MHDVGQTVRLVNGMSVDLNGQCPLGCGSDDQVSLNGSHLPEEFQDLQAEDSARGPAYAYDYSPRAIHRLILAPTVEKFGQAACNIVDA
jgi:hypothetical protein